MELSQVFKRLLLAEINAIPHQKTGRPSQLSPEDAVDHIFKLLRTGMQWREVNTTVNFTNLFRRFHKWANAGIFRNARLRELGSDDEQEIQGVAAVHRRRAGQAVGDRVHCGANSGAVHEQDVSEVFGAVRRPSDDSPPLAPPPA